MRRAWRDHLRAPNGLSLAVAAEGAGLRQRDNVLAPAARLAGSRCLGAAACEVAWLAGGEAATDGSRTSVDFMSVRAKRDASRPGRTRSTTASLAPSTTWWWFATASRSPSGSRPPTPTMRSSRSRWSTSSHRSPVRVEDRVGLGSDRSNSMPTSRTTPRRHWRRWHRRLIALWQSGAPIIVDAPGGATCPNAA
jgi:hypothetical protein